MSLTFNLIRFSSQYRQLVILADDHVQIQSFRSPRTRCIIMNSHKWDNMSYHLAFLGMSPLRKSN